LSNIQLHTTEDGSTTYFNEQVGEHYHSTFGAIQESQHIFINAGLEPFFSRKSVSVFEVGFGTGLNALLTLMRQKSVRSLFTIPPLSYIQLILLKLPV